MGRFPNLTSNQKNPKLKPQLRKTLKKSVESSIFFKPSLYNLCVEGVFEAIFCSFLMIRRRKSPESTPLAFILSSVESPSNALIFWGGSRVFQGLPGRPIDFRNVERFV